MTEAQIRQMSEANSLMRQAVRGLPPQRAVQLFVDALGQCPGASAEIFEDLGNRIGRMAHEMGRGA